MSLFSFQKLYCPICAVGFLTNFNGDGGYGYGGNKRFVCCSKSCHDELDWRRTLAILGKEYQPQPEKVHETS